MKKALIAIILAGAGLFTLAMFGLGGDKVLANVVLPVESHDWTEPVELDRNGFDIEVLIDGMPLREYYARGRGYVEASEGAEYELRVRNPLGIRVAVALSVDGLNTIDAKRTSASNASKWVIEPYGTITISGWQMSSERARRFYFTTERESYGAKLGQTANLGLISAVFFRERRPIVVVPPHYPGRNRDEERSDSNQGAPKSSAGSSGDSGNDRAGVSERKSEAYPAPDDDSAATGIGRNTRHDVRWVNLDLEDRATAEVTLRYEYRAALVRLGIRPYSDPYSSPDTLRRRERATGFEDRRYSPEP